jgi:c-di-GMP-binding flagellar brake protein YcgR
MTPADAQARRFIELRKHRRLTPPPGALLSFAQLTPAGETAEESEGDGTILNLSSGGCKILSETPVTIGQPYSLIIQLPTLLTPITIEAAIVRWINAHVFGLKFAAIERDQEEQLREVLQHLRVSAA